MPQQPKIRICPICGTEYTGKRKKTCGKPECVKALKAKSNSENMKTCICVLCGKEFQSTKANSKYCTRMHPKTCVVCGKEFIVDTTKGHATDTITCSPHCGAIYSHLNGKDKAARQANSQAKYGVDNPLQADEVKAKIKASQDANPDSDYRFGSDNFTKLIQDKYGVDNVSKLDTIKQKKSDTVMQHYGVDNPMKADDVKDNHKNAMNEKYGYDYALQVPEFKDKMADTINLHANDPSYHKNYSRISKLNINLAQKLHDDIGCETEFEAPIGNGMSADIKCTLDGRSVLVDVNPTVSHNIDVPFACLINGCDNIPNCSEHVNPITPSYHYNRIMTALKSDSTTPYLQFYDWDSYEHIKRAVIFMLNSECDENCKHCKHVIGVDDTVLISNPNPAMVRRFIEDYAYNTNPVVNQVSGISAIIDTAGSANAIASTADTAARTSITSNGSDNTATNTAKTSITNADNVSIVNNSSMIANSDSSAINTVSDNARMIASDVNDNSNTADYSAGSNVNNANGVSGNAGSSVNIYSDDANNFRVYAVARKSDACIIMLLVLVDGCVSVIPRFDADGVNHADIVNIVKNFIVKYGNIMVRLFLDSDSVIYGLLLDAGFKPIGEHEPLSAFVNMVSDNVLMTAGDSVSNNANKIAVSDGCVRVVSSGSQLFAL